MIAVKKHHRITIYQATKTAWVYAIDGVWANHIYPSRRKAIKAAKRGKVKGRP